MSISNQNILHITNGQCAVDVMRAANIAGDIIAWNDVLHEGPVPADLSLTELSAIRADFIIDQGWGSRVAVLTDFKQRDAAIQQWPKYQKILLWFEHDLYDQLQLLQILDYFADQRIEAGRLYMICTEHYLGPLAPADLLTLTSSQQVVSNEQFMLAKRAWAAFRHHHPQRWFELSRQDTSVLPFLHDAVIRLLQEYPHVGHGLSRTQYQALLLLAQRPMTMAQLFTAYQQTEQRRFLGDVVFVSLLRQLQNATPALITTSDRQNLSFAKDHEQLVYATSSAMKVLQQRQNGLQCYRLNHWLGGVHLTANNYWLWDDRNKRLYKQPI